MKAIKFTLEGEKKSLEPRAKNFMNLLPEVVPSFFNLELNLIGHD